MTIIEQTIVAKDPKKRSEDGIVVTKDFVAVIDGSTSKSTMRCHRDLSLRRHTNGELAMLTVAAYIRHAPADISCHKFCCGATQAIRKLYLKAKMPHLAEHPEDRLAASCAVFSRLRRELWLIGDCQALAIPSNVSGDNNYIDSTELKSHYFDNPKPSEHELATKRAAIITASNEYKLWKEHGGHISQALETVSNEARQAIIPRMIETMRQQNHTYSVIDGFDVAEQHVVVIPFDFKPWQLILATDGYPFLCPTLTESEQKLEEQRHNDPLNIGPDFMATKAFIKGNNSFDDKAYIRFNI